MYLCSHARLPTAQGVRHGDRTHERDVSIDENAKDVWGTGGDLESYSDSERYKEIKEEVADVLIDRAAKRIPGLRESIVVRKVATPLTNVRYVLQPEGSLHGREQTVVSQMTRRKPTTPIENLFLAGAWICGGGMTLAVGSGRSAANAAARHLSELRPPTASL